MPRATSTPKALTTKEDLLKRFEDFPAINVIERRLDNPNDPGSLPILLKGESQVACLSTTHQRALKPRATKCHQCGKPARKWHLHYCNTQIEGRWAQMKSKGYVPVLIGDLMDQEDVSDLVIQIEESGDKWVRRGDRGKEILMKQPLELYNFIKDEQARVRKARFSSKKAMREDLAEAAGKELGDEAGQTIYNGGIQVESMTRSKTTLGKEAGGD